MNRSLVGIINGRLLILFRSVNKYGCRRQFLLLVGQFRKYFHFGKMFYQFHAARRTNSYNWVVFKHSTQHQGVRSGLVAWGLSRTTNLPASTLRIHNVAVWLLFGQFPFLREHYVATTYFRYVICKSL